MLDVNSDFLTIGHRGCAGIEPENTLLSIRRAIELGCQMVEIDVHYLAGELVVIHDNSVGRTTNGKGKLESFTIEQLRELDAGKGERIPLLEEVIDLCFGKVALNIELKGEDCARPLVGLLEKRTVPEIMVSSFDWGQLTEFRSLCGRSQIAVLVDRAFDVQQALMQATELNAVAVNPSVKLTNSDLVNQAHDLGLKVYPYTVRSSGDLARVLEVGADGCFADDPSMVLEVV